MFSKPKEERGKWLAESLVSCGLFAICTVNLQVRPYICLHAWPAASLMEKKMQPFMRRWERKGYLNHLSRQV